MAAVLTATRPRPATSGGPVSLIRVLFVAAAGSRVGCAHVVRCVSVARALSVRPLVAVRGGRRVSETALGLGADVVAVARPRSIAALRPEVVVVDDPIEGKSRAWIVAARRAGALVAIVRVTASDRVVVSLDGAVHPELAGAIAEAILAVEPRAEVRLASGFVVAPRPVSSKVVWIGSSRPNVRAESRA